MAKKKILSVEMREAVITFSKEGCSGHAIAKKQIICVCTVQDIVKNILCVLNSMLQI